MIIRTAWRAVARAWRWSGEAKTSTRTTIAIFVLVGALFVTVFANASNDRDRDREFTRLLLEQVVTSDQEQCLTAVENRSNNRANWIAFYDLIERYDPNTAEALDEARAQLDINSPMLDPNTCTVGDPVPEATVTSTTTNGD